MLEYKRNRSSARDTPVKNLKVYVTLAKSDPTGWDDFAHRCDASFRCGYNASRLWQIECHPLMKCVRLDFFINFDSPMPMKIGQCAVGSRRGEHLFCDAIQLLSAYKHLWLESMQSVLDYIGPGRYRYGSDWSLDICRSGEISTIVGVSEVETNFVDLLAIDFKRWDNFDTFYSGVSKNARRNVQKAERIYTMLVIQQRFKWKIFIDLLPLEFSRFRLFAKKGISVSRCGLIGRSLCRVLATFKHSFTARLSDDRNMLARFMGISFGRHCFYLESAARDGSFGANSFLLKMMIKDQYERTRGLGTFIFGPDDHSNDQDPVWQGLARSRRQWQAEPHHTSTVNFSFC
jgi:hypothetical protein